jgi:hypothetical protein
MEWGKQVIMAGYSIGYEPSSTVYHSHDRSAYYALKRAYADHYQVADLFGWVMIPSVALAFRTMVSQTKRALPCILSCSSTTGDKIKYGMLTPLFMASVVLGQFLGPALLHCGPKQQWIARLDRQLRKGV